MVDDVPETDCLKASFLTASPDETRALAARFGALCRGGEILLLHGDLGSGKTCFAQGLAAGLGVPPGVRVTSPTFTLHGEYQGRLVLNHLDLYRLDDAGALDGLGLEDMLADTGAVAAIEWPELMAGMAGGERLEIWLLDRGEGRRSVLASAFGPRHVRLLRAFLEAE